MTSRGAGKRHSKPMADSPPQNHEPSPRRAPRLRHYLYLTLAFWGFLILQALVLSRSLGSGQMVYPFSTILGLGFLVVCVFDYTWLRTRR
jgi:hypothetical protein